MRITIAMANRRVSIAIRKGIRSGTARVSNVVNLQS
jgi:hypothetical protein